MECSYHSGMKWVLMNSFAVVYKPPERAQTQLVLTSKAKRDKSVLALGMGYICQKVYQELS